ncbi:MAG: DUF1801 domain-containing protein, partial [Usitatibacter sp.]
SDSSIVPAFAQIFCPPVRLSQARASLMPHNIVLQSAAELISKRIAELGDWRGKTLGRMRKLIKQADPDVVEEWKWMGTPVWSHDGIICTGESYKDKVKLTFAKGASLGDPARLFNSSLDGNVRRAIDIHEGVRAAACARLMDPFAVTTLRVHISPVFMAVSFAGEPPLSRRAPGQD